MDLFARAAVRDQRGQPLAERMRPRNLAEVVGQLDVLGPGKWLRRAVEEKRLGSLVLWGPPGTGKTTLGRLLASEAGAYFAAVSAVSGGVKEIREAVADAEQRSHQRNQRTVLFVDEIHRFNKAQQDALLPHVEAGTVILVGATTENPSFEVNAALLSRSRVVVLRALGDADLRVIIDRALLDNERGYGRESIDCPDDIRNLLARESRGDARRALSTLEACFAIVVPQADGVRRINADSVAEALQRKALLYDKAGDEHYAVVSAFIKSLRGTDPDAAVYWMARMLEAGEDPIFVLRRMVIFASEDIGNADPRALQIAVSALEAVKLVGLPEGIYAMTQAALYLSCAPKSNSTLLTYAAVRQDIDTRGALPVPAHLRNATTALGKTLGHGAGYQYPHDFIGQYVAATYLPDEMKGRRYYVPVASGYEKTMKERLEFLRAQAAKDDGE